jgi:O-antigen/teichoic acid export membrane protein
LVQHLQVTISKAKTFRNIIYTCLTKGATSICQLVAATVVARNLTPADYGVVGFAGIIIGFLARFSDLGIGTAVIRRPQLDQRNLSTAFTLKIILSTGAFLVALLIAPFAHHFFEHPATANVIRLLALDFLVSTIGFLSLVTLMREMNYRALVIPGVVSAVVRCLLIVVLILHGWKFWAIIVADVCATLVSGVVVQIIRTVPLRLRLDWPDAQEYLRFGIPLFGSGVLVFLIFNLDNFLVGTSMGSVKLGYYALAFTWASFICVLLNDTVNNVLLPTLSAIQNDPVAIRRWYLKTIDLVAFIAVVANTTLLVNSHFFLVTFLGKGSDKWLPAATSLNILCVYGILRAVTEPLGSCIMARGHTKTLFRSTLVSGSIELVLLLLVLRSGRIELVAAVVLFAYLSQAFVYLPYLRRDFSIGLRDIAGQLWPVIPAIAAGCLATSLLPSTLGGTFVTLAVRGLFTAMVVAITHGLFSRFRCFHEAGGMISQNFARVLG